jgi:hypothetical protein
MVQLKRKRVLAAKIETTVGTAETVDATNAAMNIYNAMLQPQIEFEEREANGSFDYLTSIAAGQVGVATFRTYLEWDGTATEPTWADTFLPACGFVKSGQVYTPRTEAPGSNVKTLTIALYEDDGSGGAVRKAIAGAMGTAVVTLPTGKMGYIDWTFSGVWQAVTNVSMLSPTYPTDSPMRYAGGLAEWNNVNMCVESAVIDFGNSVEMRECPTTTAGYLSALVTNRKLVVKVNPEATTIATQDRWANFLASTELALEIDVAGPAGGSSDAVLSFDAPKAQIMNLQEGDRKSLVTDEIDFQLNRNGSTVDQALSITFTALVA